jgi:hypothetical protein
MTDGRRWLLAFSRRSVARRAAETFSMRYASSDPERVSFAEALDLAKESKHRPIGVRLLGCVEASSTPGCLGECHIELEVYVR